MADTAAHLVERVLPVVPVRQWVLTLPYALRYRCAYDAELTSDVLRAFVWALFVELRRRACSSPARPTPPPASSRSGSRCGPPEPRFLFLAGLLALAVGFGHARLSFVSLLLAPLLVGLALSANRHISFLGIGSVYVLGDLAAGLWLGRRSVRRQAAPSACWSWPSPDLGVRGGEPRSRHRDRGSRDRRAASRRGLARPRAVGFAPRTRPAAGCS